MSCRRPHTLTGSSPVRGDVEPFIDKRMVVERPYSEGVACGVGEDVRWEVKGEVAHVLCRSVPVESVVSGERGDERVLPENVPVRIDGAADESAGSLTTTTRSPGAGE